MQPAVDSREDALRALVSELAALVDPGATYTVFIQDLPPGKLDGDGPEYFIQDAVTGRAMSVGTLDAALDLVTGAVAAAQRRQEKDIVDVL